MSTDLIEAKVGEDVGGIEETESDLYETMIYVETTNAWSQFRENLANEMFNN